MQAYDIYPKPPISILMEQLSSPIASIPSPVFNILQLLIPKYDPKHHSFGTNSII